MIKKQKFINEITKEEFDTEQEALNAETKSKHIKQLFSFWKTVVDHKDGFFNGGCCYQRNEVEYNLLIDILFFAIKKYEKFICESYQDRGGLKRWDINGQSFVGRYLDDSHSELNDWWHILGNICPKCYREYGQMCFATRCHCDGRVESFGQLEECITKHIGDNE